MMRGSLAEQEQYQLAHSMRELGIFSTSHMVEEQSKLSDAMSKWNAIFDSSSYEYEIEFDIYGAQKHQLGPFFVKVSNGVVVHVMDKDTGDRVDNTAYSPDVPTVQQLFSMIEQGLEKATYEKVRYNELVGYPEWIFINEDPEYSEYDIQDEVMQIFVKNLVLWWVASQLKVMPKG